MYSYKKTASRLRSKGRGKFSTFIISFSLSAIVLMVTMAIGISNFFPKRDDESSNKEANQKTDQDLYTMTFKLFPNDSQNINVTFDKNNPFDMTVLKEIQSYPDKNSDHNKVTALFIFKNYGVRLSDYNKYVLPKCSSEMNDLQQEYQMETNSWLPFSTIQNDAVREHEEEYRDDYNKHYYEKVSIAKEKQNKCFYDLSQSLPHHSPRPKQLDPQ